MTFRIFGGFEQLSCSICSEVMAEQTFAKILTIPGLKGFRPPSV